MKRTLVTVAFLVLSLALAVVGGTVWWSLWMNKAWPGSPGLLARALGADGEYAYDAIQLEMTAIVWLVLVVIGATILAIRRSTHRSA